MKQPGTETYIVRIYRRDRRVAGQLHGTVERTGGGPAQPFSDVEALFELLFAARDRKNTRWLPGESSSDSSRQKSPMVITKLERAEIPIARVS